MKRPASQYYWGDWRRDTALQSCSLAARGLWHEMNCLMHDCEPYGHLVVGSGQMAPAQLARLVGISPKECQQLLAELEAAGVFSRTAEGVIFSRRMVRDEALRERRANGGQSGAEFGHLGAEHGKKGGRPKRDEGGSETPLAGSQKPPPASASASALFPDEPDGSSSSAEPTADGRKGKAKKPGAMPTIPCPYDAIVAIYHELLCPPLPRCRLMPGDRQRALRKTWGWVLTSTRGDGARRAETAEQALDWFRTYFETAKANDWLMGRTARAAGHENWTCDLDFLLTPRGMKAVIEKTEVAA